MGRTFFIVTTMREEVSGAASAVAVIPGSAVEPLINVTVEILVDVVLSSAVASSSAVANSLLLTLLVVLVAMVKCSACLLLTLLLIIFVIVGSPSNDLDKLNSSHEATD